jgi:hypothetical protein
VPSQFTPAKTKAEKEARKQQLIAMAKEVAPKFGIMPESILILRTKVNGRLGWYMYGVYISDKRQTTALPIGRTYGHAYDTLDSKRQQK